MNEAVVDDRSKRFRLSFLTRWVVPVVFILLVLGLLITLVVVVLSAWGLTPGM